MIQEGDTLPKMEDAVQCIYSERIRGTRMGAVKQRLNDITAVNQVDLSENVHTLHEGATVLVCYNQSQIYFMNR